MKFFSCFGENKVVGPLSADRVFKGMPDALDAFNYWKAIRDKHLVHNESEMSFMAPSLVLGSLGEVQDILSLIFMPGLTDQAHLQLLYNLVAHTAKHVEEKVSALLPRLFEEANSMTAEERLALPQVTYSVPQSGAEARQRPRG
ncbi:hypothetical protein [Mesorhizobium sp.]|uniref:hypothetical protein n=1 Tax=Mesorhizobium sp. TaxID=1871066 RepID=UPI000FE7B00A|nr:hypothetical protein [Mesorhizobium sp.]RWQ24207.1 MAG: hypothetical protein EOR93_04630 [Mesorhizobium sp.]